MDANFKPVRIGGIELLERFPCGRYVYYHCRCLHCGKEYVLTGDEVNHHHRSCGCLGRKQTKPNIKSNLPMIDKVIEHRTRKEKWSCKIMYKDQILNLGIFGTKSNAEAASKDVEIVITKIEN